MMTERSNDKITIPVNKITWETLCEASDECRYDATVTDLQELRYLAERLIAESREYEKNSRCSAS